MPAILTIGLFATALAADPETLQRSTAWTVDRDESFCRLRADFGDGGNRMTARLAWYAPGDTFDLTLIGNRARKIGAYTAMTLDFGLGPIETTATTGNIAYRPMLLTSTLGFAPSPAEGAAPAITGAQENAVTRLDIAVAGRKPFRLGLGSMGEPLSVLRTCLAEMVKGWGYDPGMLARLRRRPEPMEPPTRWLTSADYPDGALHFRAGGVVRFRLDIDAQGAVTGCNILFRTKPDDFADLTCAAMQRRGRFAPALDADGKPVRDFYSGAVVFRIGS